MRILILLFALAATVSCGDVSGPDAVPAGGYAYSGFDARGALVVKGWLTLDLENPEQVTGTWHLSANGDASQLGPQTGDGRLEGRMDGGSLIANLNPGFADNNVVLVGPLNSGNYRGQWTFSGFAGPLNAGTFSAARP